MYKARSLSMPWLVAAILAVAGAIACLGDPQVTALYVLDIYTIPFLVLMMAYCVLMLIARQYVAALASLLAVGLLAIAALPQAAPPRPPSFASPALNIVFANLYYRNRHPEKLADWARGQNADIVVTAETTPALWNRLKPLMSSRYPYENQQGEIGIFSRYPFPYQASPGGHFGVAPLATPLGTIFLIGAHFDHPDTQVDPYSPSFAERLNERLAAVNTDKAVVVGDFNSDMSAFELSQVARDNQLNALAAPDGTWPSCLPPFLRVSLDNAFAGDRLSLSHRRVGPDIGSDHRPIAFEVRLAK